MSEDNGMDRPMNEHDDGTVTIPLYVYQLLIERAAKLDWLEQAGVDNWEGYNAAMQSMPQYNKREE